jgi:hypothetical protein
MSQFSVLNSNQLLHTGRLYAHIDQAVGSKARKLDIIEGGPQISRRWLLMETLEVFRECANLAVMLIMVVIVSEVPIAITFGRITVPLAVIFNECIQLRLRL